MSCFEKDVLLYDTFKYTKSKESSLQSSQNGVKMFTDISVPDITSRLNATSLSMVSTAFYEYFVRCSLAVLIMLCVIQWQPSNSLTTTCVDELPTRTGNKCKIVSPSKSVKDRIAFIFNNLSQNNLQAKVYSLTIDRY